MTSAREILDGLERFGIRLGLDHLRELAGELGSPERATPAVIVAGTNGKGSVASLLAAIASAGGLATGLYTSPHLESPEERIRVAGETIPAAVLADLLREVLATAARLGHASPTYFEAMTLAAFLHFARRSCDLAVLEVGMGGRLDATNLADARLAVIAAIALDHQEFLGSTLDAIAREKAGVLRPGRPAIFAPQVPAAAVALAEEAARRGARALDVGDEVVAMEVRFRGLAGLGIRLTTRQRSYELESTLAGRHQAWNVATAVVAAEQFAAAGLPALFRPPRSSPASRRAGGPAGSKLCPCPTRARPCCSTQRTTPPAARPWSSSSTSSTAPSPCSSAPWRTRTSSTCCRDLAARASRVVLTRPPSPRAADPATLTALVPTSAGVEVEPEIAAALHLALRGEPDLVVACGSIFLIGELRTLCYRGFRQ